MNESIKPNDILLATLLKPQATVSDLLKSDITPSNTGLLTADEYKSLPLIQKIFSDQVGVFNDDAFNKTYASAAQKYNDLTDEDMYPRIEENIKYGRESTYAPLGSKKVDTFASVETIKNTEHNRIGYIALNATSRSEKTKQELAQQSKYWDNSKGLWSEKSLEDTSFFKKAFGKTLKYAKYENDEYDQDGTFHQKGEWKLNDNGEYYAETIEGDQLKDSEVVKFLDVLTDEDSWMNNLDCFDSDGYDKSTGGIIMKTLFSALPYCIPAYGINKSYGALVAGMGVVLALPSIYKSLEGLVLGEEETALSKNATKMENWFYKFQPSKSQKGSLGFWNLESMAGMVSDVFGLIYQQRAAASLATVLKSSDNIKKTNDLAASLSLGYMALISAGDAYNDAINAGYDRRTAGLTSLATTGALYGIMRYNETAKGWGTWFLDKTTGYNQEIERGSIWRVLKPVIKESQGTLDKMVKTGDRKGIANWMSIFKRKAKELSWDLRGRTETIWKNALVEGVEEVTEEMVQDGVKGMVDTMSWLGWTGKKGSFGGWDNVFSKEGLNRYLSTFVGGAVGGAMFDIQLRKIEPFLSGEKSHDAADLDDILFTYGPLEVIKVLDRWKKSFNSNVSPEVIKIGDKSIRLMAGDGASTETDVLYDLVKNLIISRFESLKSFLKNYDKITRGIGDLKWDDFKKDYLGSKFAQVVKDDYILAVLEVVNNKAAYKSIEKQEGATADLKKEAKDRLQLSVDKVNNFINGENYFRYTIAYDIMNDKEFMKSMTNIDKESYIKHLWNTDYKDLPDEKTPKQLHTKEEADKEWLIYIENQLGDVFKSTMLSVADLYLDLLKKIAPHLKLIKNNEKLKNFLKMWKSLYYGDEGASLDAIAILDLANASLFDSADFNYAEFLEDNGVIDLSEFKDDEQREVVRNYINQEFRTVPSKRLTVNLINNVISNLINETFEHPLSSNAIPSIQKLLELNLKDSDELPASLPKIKLDISKITEKVINFRLIKLLDFLKENKGYIDDSIINELENLMQTASFLSTDFSEGGYVYHILNEDSKILRIFDNNRKLLPDFDNNSKSLVGDKIKTDSGDILTFSSATEDGFFLTYIDEAGNEFSFADHLDYLSTMRIDALEQLNDEEKAKIKHLYDICKTHEDAHNIIYDFLTAIDSGLESLYKSAILEIGSKPKDLAIEDIIKSDVSSYFTEDIIELYYNGIFNDKIKEYSEVMLGILTLNSFKKDGEDDYNPVKLIILDLFKSFGITEGEETYLDILLNLQKLFDEIESIDDIKISEEELSRINRVSGLTGSDRNNILDTLKSVMYIIHAVIHGATDTQSLGVTLKKSTNRLINEYNKLWKGQTSDDELTTLDSEDGFAVLKYFSSVYRKFDKISSLINFNQGVKLLDELRKREKYLDTCLLAYANLYNPDKKDEKLFDTEDLDELYENSKDMSLYETIEQKEKILLNLRRQWFKTDKETLKKIIQKYVNYLSTDRSKVEDFLNGMSINELLYQDDGDFYSRAGFIVQLLIEDSLIDPDEYLKIETSIMLEDDSVIPNFDLEAAKRTAFAYAVDKKTDFNVNGTIVSDTMFGFYMDQIEKKLLDKISKCE